MEAVGRGHKTVTVTLDQVMEGFLRGMECRRCERLENTHREKVKWVVLIRRNWFYVGTFWGIKVEIEEFETKPSNKLPEVPGYG